jgi:hypothetical protein
MDKNHSPHRGLEPATFRLLALRDTWGEWGNIKNNNGCHNFELYSSKLLVANCIFCNKLPNNIKQIGNNKCEKDMELLIKGCYFSIKVILLQKSVILLLISNCKESANFQ